MGDIASLYITVEGNKKHVIKLKNMLKENCCSQEGTDVM